ncbi:hypothetical protein [Vibrio ichthyoenteri]|nr:hypothetical protein [Vibrio ichthyoenteri]
MRTIWLVLLTALALVASSMASSKSLMPIQMLQMNASNHSGVSSCTSQSQSDNLPAMTEHHRMMSDISSMEDCPTNSAMQHDCCDTTCLTVVAALIGESTDIIRVAHSVIFPLESSTDIIHMSRSLYRPPNA